MRKWEQAVWEHIKSPLSSVQRKCTASHLGKDCGRAGNDVTCWLSNGDTTLRSLFRLILSFVMPANRKRKVPSPYLWNPLKTRHLTAAPLRSPSAIAHQVANRDWAICALSLTGCHSVDWRTSLPLNPIQKERYHRNTEYSCVPAGNPWNHTQKTPAKKTPASHAVTFEL